MLKYVKAFARDELDLALVNSNILVTFLIHLIIIYPIKLISLTHYNN